jgi:hypothetical protein
LTLQISGDVQFPLQLTCVPVHGSVNEPQESGGHVVSGLQQRLASGWPATPHTCPLEQWFVQVTALPVQGSVHVPPQ